MSCFSLFFLIVLTISTKITNADFDELIPIFDEFKLINEAILGMSSNLEGCKINLQQDLKNPLDPALDESSLKMKIVKKRKLLSGGTQKPEKSNN